MSSILDALRKVEAERMQAAQPPLEESITDEAAEPEAVDETPAPREAVVMITRGRLIAAGAFLGLCLILVPVTVFHLLNRSGAPETGPKPPATVAAVAQAPAPAAATQPEPPRAISPAPPSAPVPPAAPPVSTPAPAPP